MKNTLFCRILIGLAAAGMSASEADGIFHYKTGDFDVYMLLESRGAGRQGILIGLSEADFKKYTGGKNFESETNTFLITGKGMTVVVDTGFGGAIFEKMKVLGVDPADVDAVLLTHMHGDHIGGMAKDGKALFPKAKVYLAAIEKDYWTKTNVNKGAVAALEPYGSRVETFTPGALGGKLREVLPGIEAIATYGHTPGHTSFLVGGKLLIWGDLMHAELVQFPRPDISVTYDVDPVQAAKIRKAVLDYAAKNGLAIGGMHLVYPAVGTVTPEGSGFRFMHAD